MFVRKFFLFYIILQLFVVFFGREIHRVEHHLYYKHHSFQVSHLIEEAHTSSEEEMLNSGRAYKNVNCSFWNIFIFLLSTEENKQNTYSFYFLCLVIFIYLVFKKYKISLNQYNYSTVSSRAPPIFL